MIQTCECGTEFITEADPYVILPTMGGPVTNCGCHFTTPAPDRIKPLKKFDDETAMNEIANQGQDLTPIHVISMMIARMHEYYNEEHKKFVRQIHGFRNDPVWLNKIIQNQLKSKFNPETNSFEVVEKHPLEI